jgi:hypothetical protein
LFCAFPQSLQANAGVVLQNRPKLYILPISSFTQPPIQPYITYEVKKVSLNNVRNISYFISYIYAYSGCHLFLGCITTGHSIILSDEELAQYSFAVNFTSSFQMLSPFLFILIIVIYMDEKCIQNFDQKI